MPCTAPHRQPTPDCPPAVAPAPPTSITVVLPIPTGTTFVDANNGGMSDGVNITWTVPPLGACGVFPNPPCPVLTTHLTVSPLFPVDTFIQNQATATDGDGTVQSNVDSVKVGTFAGSRLTLRYPVRPLHDSDLYLTRFTLLPGQSIDPANEAFHFQVSNLARGTFVDFSLPAGAMQSNGGTAFLYRASPPGSSPRAAGLHSTFATTFSRRTLSCSRFGTTAGSERSSPSWRFHRVPLTNGSPPMAGRMPCVPTA